MIRPVFEPADVGKRLSEMRGERTFAALAKFLGVSKSTLNKIEHGGVPKVRVETVVRICTGLNIRLEWLILGIPPRDMPPDIKRRSS